MDELAVSKICNQRMQGWVEDLVNINCTPVLLVGVGHGKMRGQTHLFTPDDVPDKALLHVLSIATIELRKRGLWDKVSNMFTEVEPIQQPVGHGKG